MKTKITNNCGGKKGGCSLIEYTLPSGIVKEIKKTTTKVVELKKAA